MDSALVVMNLLFGGALAALTIGWVWLIVAYFRDAETEADLIIEWKKDASHMFTLAMVLLLGSLIARCLS